MIYQIWRLVVFLGAKNIRLKNLFIQLSFDNEKNKFDEEEVKYRFKKIKNIDTFVKKYIYLDDYFGKKK